MKATFWLVLLVVFLLAETQTVTLISTWFAVGSLAALVANLLGADIWLQVVLFLAISGVCLALLRPIARKYFTPKLTRTNVDAIVGKTCKVVATINNDAACGQIRIGDVEWTARSTTGEPIPVDTQVKIDRVEGVKAYVTPVTVEVK